MLNLLVFNPVKSDEFISFHFISFHLFIHQSTNKQPGNKVSMKT